MLENIWSQFCAGLLTNSLSIVAETLFNMSMIYDNLKEVMLPEVP